MDPWLIVLTVVLGIIFLFCLLFFIGESSHTTRARKQELLKYKGKYFAHRGLYDNSTDCPENSLNAFQKAVDNGFGIELDTQLTKDKKVVIVHDASLKRNCGIDKTVQECTYEELQTYKLFDSDQTIPLFTDVLKVIDGKVPLIVEVKVEKDYKETTVKGQAILDKYDGDYVAESFNPQVVRWYRKHRPDIIRGQLAYNSMRDKDSKLSKSLKFILSNTLFNFETGPDFIAYDCRNYHHICNLMAKYVYRIVTIAWTIKSQEELTKKEKFYDLLIFDSFVPNKNEK